MRNKKLIPFEIIEKAVAREQESVDTVLQHYTLPESVTTYPLEKRKKRYRKTLTTG